MTEFCKYLEKNGNKILHRSETNFAVSLSKLNEALKVSQELETAIIGGYLCSKEDVVRKEITSWRCWFCDPHVGELDREYLARSRNAVIGFVASLSDEEKRGAHLYFLFHDQNNHRNYAHLNDDSELFQCTETYHFKSPEIEYSVSINPSKPNHIQFEFFNEVEVCSIDRKDWKREEINQISVGGMIAGRTPIISETSWFQFEIGHTPSISYWNDRILIRKDNEVV